jgi:hypothetical protein
MAEVSAEVMRLVQRAQARIPELLQQAAAETAVEGDQTAETLVSDAQRTFPAPPADEPVEDPVDRARRFLPEDAEEAAPPPRQPSPPSAPPQQQPPARRRKSSHDDDDFGGSIMS